jgi:hypothetical protein
MNGAFPITIFRDWSAVDKIEREVTVDGVIELVRGTSAARKDDLPLLKLATFGDIRTRYRCLRNNANMLRVSGAECDYDGEEMPFDEAAGCAQRSRILTILYTSPSHRPDAPRWRAIHPFAGPMQPAGRANMVDRANWIFGGVLNAESWTLSQSFYYGRVNDNFRIELVEGDPIDTRIDLGSIGKHAPEPRDYSEGEPIDAEQFRAAGAAAAEAAVDLPYPRLMPLIMATARVNVIGDADRSIRLEVARRIRSSTPGSRMDEGRFLAAFDAPIREGQMTSGPPTFFHYARLGGWVAAPAPPERYRALFAEGAARGRRHDALARLTGHLLGRRLDPLLVLGIVMMWNRERLRPPLGDDEVRQTVDGICAAELRKKHR